MVASIVLREVLRTTLISDGFSLIDKNQNLSCLQFLFVANGMKPLRMYRFKVSFTQPSKVRGRTSQYLKCLNDRTGNARLELETPMRG